MWRSCWPNVASWLIMSPSIAGCSGSPPLLVDAARPCRHTPGDRWFVDETSVIKVAGRWVHLSRSKIRFVGWPGASLALINVFEMITGCCYPCCTRWCVPYWVR
jgi:hypothetical protein